MIIIILILCSLLGYLKFKVMGFERRNIISILVLGNIMILVLYYFKYKL
jgi:hypothetical protein